MVPRRPRDRWRQTVVARRTAPRLTPTARRRAPPPGASSDERDQDTSHQLVRRRLWPVAIVSFGAVVAVPMVLAKAPVLPPATTAARSRRARTRRPASSHSPTARARSPSVAACSAREGPVRAQGAAEGQEEQGDVRTPSPPRTRPRRPTRAIRAPTAKPDAGTTVPPGEPGADRDPRAHGSRVLDQGALRRDRGRAGGQDRRAPGGAPGRRGARVDLQGRRGRRQGRGLRAHRRRRRPGRRQVRAHA